MKKYCWKNAGFGKDVQKIGEELETISVLSSSNVVEFARNNEDSALHNCFEWDNTIAGEKYRNFQASLILSSISFKIEEEPVKKQRVYVSVKKENKSDIKTFKPFKEVLENDEEYNALINKAKTDFNTCKKNYENLLKRDDLKNILFDIYREV